VRVMATRWRLTPHQPAELLAVGCSAERVAWAGHRRDALASRGHHAKEKAMDMLLRAKEFTVKSASGAKDLALNAKDIHKDLFVFQKTLRDMIKGMRNMRDQEERYLAEALQVAP
jgi:hypothetical protein